jgi:hypothetical protein
MPKSNKKTTASRNNGKKEKEKGLRKKGDRSGPFRGSLITSEKPDLRRLSSKKKRAVLSPPNDDEIVYGDGIRIRRDPRAAYGATQGAPKSKPKLRPFPHFFMSLTLRSALISPSSALESIQFFNILLNYYILLFVVQFFHLLIEFAHFGRARSDFVPHI